MGRYPARDSAYASFCSPSRSVSESARDVTAGMRASQSLALRLTR